MTMREEMSNRTVKVDGSQLSTLVPIRRLYMDAHNQVDALASVDADNGQNNTDET
jgi:hypothetical protein